MTYTVRTQGRLVTAEQFGEIVVRANPDGSVVHLKDLARVELGSLNYNEVSRFDGQPSCIVAIFLTPGANAVAVAEAARKVMAQLSQRFPPTWPTTMRSTQRSPLPKASTKSWLRCLSRWASSSWLFTFSCRIGARRLFRSSQCRCHSSVLSPSSGSRILHQHSFALWSRAGDRARSR